MTFLNPILLAAGLACIALPILIHILMNRRRRPVAWGAMRFVIEAYRRQRRRLLLEQWLLLALRCLLVLLVALAIGRPLMGGAGGASAGPRTLYLVIDNSLASGVLGPDGRSALSAHQEAARELLAALAQSPAPRVGLVTLAFPAEGLVVPPSTDLAAVGEIIDGLEPLHASADLPGALRLLASAAEGPEADDGSATAVAVLSEFRAGSADLQRVLPRLAEGWSLSALTPADRAASSAAVVSAEPLRSVLVAGEGEEPSADDQIRVTLRRHGPMVAQAQTIEARVSDLLAGPGAPSARTSVRFAPGQAEAWTSVALGLGAGGTEASGPRALEVELPADDLPEDNVYRRPLEVRSLLRVGVAAPRQFGTLPGADALTPAQWLRLALRPGETGSIEVVDFEPASLDQARLSALDALVLPRPDLLSSGTWARLAIFVEQGGMLLVMPPIEVGVHTWADEFSSALGVPWSLSREPVEAGPEAGWAIEAPPAGSLQPGDLLHVLSGELDDLLPPVRVWRTVPIVGGVEAGRTVLSLSTGEPLVWAWSPSSERSGGAAGAGADRPPGSAGESDAAGGVASRGSRGLVVYLSAAADLTWTDLPARPLMVPLIQELVRQGVGRARGQSSATAGSQPEVAPGAVELRRVDSAGRDGGGGRVLRIGESGVPDEPIRRAGVWEARDARGQRVGLLSINFDPAGSDPSPQPRAQVEEWLRQASSEQSVRWLASGSGQMPEGASPAREVFAGAENRAPVSFPLLLLALGLAVLEAPLARLASHASVGSGRGKAGA